MVQKHNIISFINRGWPPGSSVYDNVYFNDKAYRTGQVVPVGYYKGCVTSTLRALKTSNKASLT